MRRDHHGFLGWIADFDLLHGSGGEVSCSWFSPTPDDSKGQCGPCYAGTCDEGYCDDDKDNDGDGAIDCEDGDCKGATCGEACQCGDPEDCTDGLDNSGDDAVDCAADNCADSGCQDKPRADHGKVCDLAKQACVCPPATAS